MAAFEGIVLYTLAYCKPVVLYVKFFLQLYAVFSLWFLCSWAFVWCLRLCSPSWF